MMVEELLTYLFDSRPNVLAEEMGNWLDSSRRFSVFASTFRDKIRKKLRVTQDEESLYDLRLELETAFLLFQERGLSLVYEPELAEGGRSPDFAVTFTTSLTFMVEVTRLRGTVSQADEERIADALCTKLGQLLPQRGNVIIVGLDALRLTQIRRRRASRVWCRRSS